MTKPVFRYKVTLKCVVSLLLIIILILSTLSVSKIKTLRFSYDIEKFFPTDNDDVKFYRDFKSKFENENDYLIIGITNSNGIFHQKFLENIDSLTTLLLADSNVKSVFSPTNLSHRIKAPLIGFTKIPVIHFKDPSRYKHDKERIYNLNDFNRSFFSNDTLSVRIILKLKNDLTQKEGFDFLDSTQEKVADFNFDETHMAGRISTQHYYIGAMQSEIRFFIILASLIIIASLFLALGNIRILLLILLSIVLTMLNVFGLIVLSGQELNLMIVMLPAIIIITSTSSSIHFFSHLTLSIQSGASNIQALSSTIRETGLPIFLNSATTAIGFASLMLIPVRPIQLFGLFAASGILISFLVTFILNGFFALIAGKRIGKSNSIVKTSAFSIFNGRKLSGKSTLLIMTLIFGLGAVAVINVNTNNYFLEDLNDQSSLKKDLVFFKKNFDGIRPFELVVQIKNNKGMEDRQVLDDLILIEKQLIQTYNVNFVTSPLAVIRSANMTLHSGDQAYYTIPENKVELQKLFALINKHKLWNKFNLIDGRNVRMSMRINDIGSTKFAAMQSDFETFAKTKLKRSTVRFTGAAFLMDKANDSISKNLILGISIAIVLSTLFIYFITKSLKLSLISIIPNVIPLLFAVILMWLFNLSLNIGTAMVFTIIYGLAVDDTMHILHKYSKYARSQRHKTALARSFLELRKPMLNTSVVLAMGFLTFSFSEFNSISIIGILIGSSLVVALLADFYVLPVLLGRGKKS